MTAMQRRKGARAEVDPRIAELEAEGYVVLRAKSYRQAQERQRIAECQRESEKRDAGHARDWARECLANERRLGDRCTYLYGLAARHGATDDELRGPT